MFLFSRKEGLFQLVRNLGLISVWNYVKDQSRRLFVLPDEGTGGTSGPCRYRPILLWEINAAVKRTDSSHDAQLLNV